jgi:DNA-binding NtrC family response regulator
MPQRVLIVDDEMTILIAFRKLFKCPGVEVDIAESIEEAKALLSGSPYDAVIADLRLSGIAGEEGLEIIQYVKYRHPGTHVILITAYGSQDIQEKAYNLGAAFYFEKPISTSVLKDSLRSLGVIFQTSWS